jgi:hypothetical protein
MRRRVSSSLIDDGHDATAPLTEARRLSDRSHPLRNVQAMDRTLVICWLPSGPFVCHAEGVVGVRARGSTLIEPIALIAGNFPANLRS